jgi:hypothetical protein
VSPRRYIPTLSTHEGFKRAVANGGKTDQIRDLAIKGGMKTLNVCQYFGRNSWQHNLIQVSING